jgi:peptidoglycan/xylan/chitin deacetylase (PgdA/CDA1 family)
MSPKVPILTYHSIDDSDSVISISPEKFRSQMYHLREKNFNVISLKDITACLVEKVPFPSRSVVITFDDGFKNFYDIAYPVLKNLGFTATVFLVPGYCDKNNKWHNQPKGIPVLDLLDWEQVREMADNGIDFGAHTMNHVDLLNLTLEQAREEIVNSKRFIEKYLDKSVQFFAYPYGQLNNEIKAIVHDIFSGACSVELDLVDGNSDINALPRIEMYYFSNNNLFTWLGTSKFPFYIKIRNSMRLFRKQISFITGG